jgi:hypothetical protein
MLYELNAITTSAGEVRARAVCTQSCTDTSTRSQTATSLQSDMRYYYTGTRDSSFYSATYSDDQAYLQHRKV